MDWLVYDTIENSFFFKGVMDVENDLPLQEVCQLIPNQMSYEHGRFFNTYLKSIGQSYTQYLHPSGKIKSENTENLWKVIYRIQDELDLRGLL